MNKHEIALHYERKIFAGDTKTRNSSNAVVTSFSAELMQLGFVPSLNLIKTLGKNSEAGVSSLFHRVVPILREMKGADVEYVPFYPNFPQQVMEASDAELFLNAIFHYLTQGHWKPNYQKLPRGVSLESFKFETIDIISDEDFMGIFTKLLSSNDSISEYDKLVIEWFMDNYEQDELVYPAEIPFKETMCVVAGKSIAQGKSCAPLINTATDVLRIVTHLSDGDISLAENTKFISLPKRIRRDLTLRLDEVISEEDIARHSGKWIKLFHGLHVGDFSQKVYDVARKVRNNQKIPTFNGRMEKAIREKNLDGALSLLTKRPGIFARKFSHLLKVFTDLDDRTRIIESFSGVTDQVSSRVLIQLYGIMKARMGDVEKRVVFPKGMTQKAILLRDKLPRLDPKITSVAISHIASSLVQRFRKSDPLGKVWIDERLQGCPLPTQQRSASDGLFQVARGTRLPFDDKGTLRFFIYWVGRDIDLSAVFLDENFKSVGQVSYTNLRSSGLKAYHSGDITNAPNGAAEFIDIDIAAARKQARYISMNVYVYSGPNFSEHEKVYAGWMGRDKPNDGEIFDPKSVKQRIDLTSESRFSTPVIFDLETRDAIWVDVTARSGFGPNNLHTNKATVSDQVEAMVDMETKMSLAELFNLHVLARGDRAESIEEADTVFSVDREQTVAEGARLITPYDITTINSEFVV